MEIISLNTGNYILNGNYIFKYGNYILNGNYIFKLEIISLNGNYILRYCRIYKLNIYYI